MHLLSPRIAAIINALPNHLLSVTAPDFSKASRHLWFPDFTAALSARCILE